MAKGTRPLVRKLDKPCVVFPHRNGRSVPALPDLAQTLRITVLGEDLGDLLDVQTVVRCAAGAVLRATVDALHPGDEPRQLLGLLHVRRRRHRQGILEHVELPALQRRQLDTVEARGRFRVPGQRVDECLIRVRRHQLGVGGDVGVLRPTGATRGVPEPQKLAVGPVEKRTRVIARRFAGLRL
jgi:hypothetical protein